MNANDFWDLIGAIDQDALGQGSDALAVAPLQKLLSARPPREQRSFESHLARSLFALDGEVFARCAGPSGDSGDGFLYWRCGVVAKGENFFRRVLANPCFMPEQVDLWCEPLLSVAANAWAERTGRPAEEWAFEPAVSYETGSNEAQWPPRTPAPTWEPPIEQAFARATARAGHEFRARRYPIVMELLTPYEHMLSKKLLSMLLEARAQSSSRGTAV